MILREKKNTGSVYLPACLTFWPSCTLSNKTFTKGKLVSIQPSQTSKMEL